MKLAKLGRGGVYLSLTLILVLGFQNCGTQMSAGEDSFVVENSNLASLSRPVTTCVFNGDVLASGQKVTTFLQSSVPQGSLCQSEVRECASGQLSGTYQFPTCSEDVGASCLFNGVSIPDGNTVQAFVNSAVNYGETCRGQMRKCTNGVLDGSYNSASCAVAAGRTCKFNGRDLASGESVTASETSTVAAGKTCKNQTRNCDNGVLSGSYAFASCAEAFPAACLFNGQTIPHAGTVTAFEKSAVFSTGTCNDQVRTCNNGKLSGKFEFASCEKAKANGCIFAGNTYVDGQKFYAYKKGIRSGIVTCFAKERSCSDGKLTGDSDYKLANADCSK